MVGGRLQVGVAVHLEQVIGRPGQAVEVGDRRAVGVVVDAAVAGLVGDAQAVLEDLVLGVEEGLGVILGLVLEILLEAVADVDPGLFAFAAHDDVDIGLLAALFGQHADVGAAEDDQAVVHFLDHACRAPGLLDLGRIGRNAHQLRLVLLDELRNRLVFDVGVKDDDLVAAALAHGGQVGQAEMRRGAGVNRETKSGIH